MEVTDIHVDSNRPSKRSLEVSIAVKIKLKKQKELLDSDENYSGEEVEEDEEVEVEGEEERRDDQYHEYIHEYESGFSEAPFDDFLQSYESEQGDGTLPNNLRHIHYSTAKTHSRKSSDSNATFDMSVISEEDEPLNKSEEIILHEIQADKLHCSTEKEKEDREKSMNLRNKRNISLEQVEEPLIIAEKIDDTKRTILSDILSDIVVDDFILIQTEKDYFASDGDTKDESAASNEIELTPDKVRKNSCEEMNEKGLTIEKETDWISSKKRTASVSTCSDYVESSESPHITSDEMRSSNEEEKEDEMTEIEESCNQSDLLVVEDELKPSYSNEVDLLGSYSTGAEVLDTLSTETDLLGSFAHTDFLASYKTEYELTDSSVTEAEIISSCNYELDSVKQTFATCKPACSVSEGKKDLCSEARELVNELKKEVEVLDLIASELDSQVYCTNEETVCTKDLEVNNKDQRAEIKELEVDAKDQRMNIKDLGKNCEDLNSNTKNQKTNSKEQRVNVKDKEKYVKNQKVDDKNESRDIRDQGMETKKDHVFNLEEHTKDTKNLQKDNQEEGIDFMDLGLDIEDLRNSFENQKENFMNQKSANTYQGQDIEEQYLGSQQVLGKNAIRLFTKEELIDTDDEKVEELHVTDVIRTEYIEHEDLTDIDFINNKVSIFSCDDVNDVRVVRDIMHVKEPIRSKQIYGDSIQGYKEMMHNEEHLEEINVITTTTTMTTQVFQSELNFDWDIRSPIEEGCLSQLSATIRNDYESAFKEYKNELLESELMNETAVSISNDLTDGVVDSSGYFSEFVDMARISVCEKEVSVKSFKGEEENTDKHEDKQNNDHSAEEGISSWTNTKNDDHSKSLEIGGGDSGRDRLTPSSLLTGHDISDIELDTDLPLDDSVASQQNERSERPRPANFNWCNDISSLPDDSFGVTRDECVYKDDDDKLAISTKSRNSELTELCEKIDILNESYDLAELKEKIEDLNKNDDDFSEDIKEKMNEITAYREEKGSNKKDKKSSSKLMKKNYEFTELSEKVDELNELLEPVYEKKVSQRLRYKSKKERFPALLAQSTSNEDLSPKPKRDHAIRPSSEKLKYPKTPCPVEKNHKTVDFWEGDRVLCINDRVFDFGKPVEDIDNKDKSTPWNYTNRNSQVRLMDYQALSKLANRSVSSRDDDTSLRSIEEPLMDFNHSIDVMSSSRSVEEPISSSIDDIISLHSVDEPISLQSSYNDEMELPHDDEFPIEHLIDDSEQSNEQICPININDTFDQNCTENDSLDQIVETFTSSLPDERVLSIEDLKSLPEKNEEVNKSSDSGNSNSKSSEDIGSNTYITASEIPKNPFSGMKKETEWFNNKKLDFRWDSGIESQEDLSIVEDAETKKDAQTELKSCTTNSNDKTNPVFQKHNKDISSGSFPTDCSFNDFFKNMKLFIVDPKNQTARTANQVLNFDWDKDPHTCDDEISTKDIAEEDADAFSETKSSIADMDHINLFREEDKPTLDLTELVSLIPNEDNDDQMTTDSYRELIEIERFEQLEKLCKESEKFPDFHWLAEESAKLSMSRTDPELAIREIGPNEVLSSSVREIEPPSERDVEQKKPPHCWDGMKENTCKENVIFDIPISWSRPFETAGKETAPWNNQSDYETDVYYESTALDETYVEEEKVADLSTISETGEDNITFSEEQCEPDETSIEWFAVKQLGLNWEDMLENTIDTSQEYSDHVDILSAISEEELSLSESADIIRDMTSSMRDSTSISNRLKARKKNNDAGEAITVDQDTHQHGSGINECFTCKSLDTVDEKLRELSNFIADGENTLKSSQISPSTVESYSSKRSSLAEGSSTDAVSNNTPKSIPKKFGTILPTIEMSMKDNRTVSPSPEPRSMIPVATKRIKGVDCGSVSKRKKNDSAKRGNQVNSSFCSSYSPRQNSYNENLVNSFNSEYSNEQCELDQNVEVNDNLSKSGTMVLHQSNTLNFHRNDELGVKRRIEMNNNTKHNVSADETGDVFDVGNNVINVCENDDVPSDNFVEKDVKTNSVSPLSESIVTIEDFVIITQDEIQYVTENLEQDKCEKMIDLNASISSKSSRSNSLELSCFTNVDEIEDETFPSIPLSFSWDKKTKNHYDEIIAKESDFEEYTIEKDDIKNKKTDKISNNLSDEISDKYLGKDTEIFWSKNMINETNNRNRITSCKVDLNENKENVDVNFKSDEKENKSTDSETNGTNNSDSITKKFMIELTKRSKKGFKKGLNYINCLDGDLHDTKNYFENGLIETTMNGPKQLTVTEKEVTIPSKEKTRRCSNNCQGNKNNMHNVTIGDKDSDNTDASSVVSTGDLSSNVDMQEVCDSCGQKVKEENELTSSELESDAEDQVLKIFVDLSIE